MKYLIEFKRCWHQSNGQGIHLMSGQMTTCGVSYPRSHAKFLLRLISHYEGIGGEPWKNRHSRSVF